MTTHLTDFVQRGLDRLPSQFQGKAKIEAFLRVLLAPGQEVEDALWQLLTERTAAVAVGVTLTQIGNLVGQPRNGLTDEELRPYVLARIASNKSNGTIPTILRIARIALNDELAQPILENTGAAAFVLRILGITVTETVANILIDILNNSIKGGVRIILETSADVDAEMFYTARAAFLDGALAGGETTIDVLSTEGFPATGSLDIDVGLAVEETVTYTGITSTSFIGVSAVANAHVDRSAVYLVGSLGKGLGDSTNAALGGKMASARDRVL